jgi:hypothetical protein
VNQAEIFKKLIKNVDEDMIIKNNEIQNKINLKKGKFIYNKIKYLRKKSIPFRLNPYLIRTLPLINGGFNFNLYSLDKFAYFFKDYQEKEQGSNRNKNVMNQYTLLEIVKSDNEIESKIEYFIFLNQSKVNENGLIEKWSVEILE